LTTSTVIGERRLFLTEKPTPFDPRLCFALEGPSQGGDVALRAVADEKRKVHPLPGRGFSVLHLGKTERGGFEHREATKQ